MDANAQVQNFKRYTIHSNITITINLQSFKINNKQFKFFLGINFAWHNKPNCSDMIWYMEI